MGLSRPNSPGVILLMEGYELGGKRGRAQMVFGLLFDFDGCPVVLEAFSANTRN